MEQINAIVDCDVARLNIPLRPWFARKDHGFVALLRRIPADVTGVYVRVYMAALAGQTPAIYTDVQALEHADGSWMVRCPTSCFTANGDSHYEVRGIAADDQPCAIGEGRLNVASSSL